MQLTHVSFRYPRSDHDAIRDVTVGLDSGTTGLLGTNGAGKTTLIRLMLRELAPTRGDVTATLDPNRLAVGYCPQDARFPSAFRVREVLSYLAWLRRIPARQREAEVCAAISAADLERHDYERMGALSGGLRRRVAIAQAFLGRPALVLLDEPTTGLDPEQRVRCREQVREAARDATVLLSSHIIEDVSALADHVLVLDAGRVVRQFLRPELDDLDERALEHEFLRAVTRPRP